VSGVEKGGGRGAENGQGSSGENSCCRMIWCGHGIQRDLDDRVHVVVVDLVVSTNTILPGSMSPALFPCYNHNPWIKIRTAFRYSQTPYLMKRRYSSS
jgi:hypothetical protein